MKVHSINYFDTFIEVAEDTKVDRGTKTYGYGLHSDSNGKVALVGMETDEYQKFLADEHLKKIKAMKSNK